MGRKKKEEGSTKDLLIEATNSTIVAMLLSGVKQKDIAEKLGVHKSTICRRLQREDVKELLEYGQKRNAMRVPIACDAVDDLIQSTNEQTKLKAAELTFKGTGILPTHAMPIYIGQVIQDNRQQIITPDVLALLSKHLGDNQDAIDVKPLELDKIRPKEDG